MYPISSLVAAFANGDGRTAADLLDFDSGRSMKIRQYAEAFAHPSFKPSIAPKIPGQLGQAVLGILQSAERSYCAQLALSQSGASIDPEIQAMAEQAVELARSATGALRTCVRDCAPAFWLLPVVNVSLLRLRRSAALYDSVASKPGLRDSAFSTAADLVLAWYRTVMADREEWHSSLQQGKLMILSHLFKVFYRLGNIRRCSDLIREAEKHSVTMSLFPKAQAVTYQYYLGCTYIFEEAYARAEECLEFALKHCHRAAPGNLDRILHVLTPLRLLTGKSVSGKELLARGFVELAQLTDAVQRGDLERFNECAQNHMLYFIAKGVYLVVERLRMNTYRNLFRKVHTLYIKKEFPERSHVLPLPVLHAALRVRQESMDTDELECILANLISMDLIKGYIAHGKAVVLTKKGDPFP